MDKFIISVLELNTYVGDNIYSDPFLDDIWIKGEIADVNVNRNTAYFILTDTYSSVNCVLFNYSENGFDLIKHEGAEILLNGKITLFKKNGSFKIIADKIEHYGEGIQNELFQLLKDQLEKEGIFALEHKRSIPQFPQKIGIVTSKEGAAIHDFVYNINRRNPFVKIILYPVKVQGDGAPGEIVKGIEFFNKNVYPDVLLVGRGGGSAEDLNAFNDETVVRAVYNSKIPIISAVGHENDFTLTDLAADLRVSTPTAAAELAVPLANDIINKLSILNRSLNDIFLNKIHSAKDELFNLKSEIDTYAPRKYILKLYEKLFQNKSGLKQTILRKFGNLNLRYAAINEKLVLLNPQTARQSELIKVFKAGKEIVSALELYDGDLIEISFKDGNVDAEIKKTTENNNERKF